MRVIAPNPATTDFNIVHSFVQMAYRTILGREADDTGLEDWTASLTSGEMTARGLLVELLDTDEFYENPRPPRFEEHLDELLRAMLEASPGELVPESEGYLKLAFQTLLRREPTASDLADYQPRLEDQTLSTSQFLQYLLRSDELAPNVFSDLNW
jgi:hypothetical protein